MIPKIIHFCWISGDPYPELVRNCINTWKRVLPDYEFRLWDSSSFDFSSVSWTKQAFAAGKYAFVSDFIRFYALYNYGGIYLDSDVEVLKRFDDLLDLPYFVCKESNPDKFHLEVAAFGAEKGTEWIGDCLDFYMNSEFILQDGRMNMKPCPVLMMEGVLDRKYDFLRINSKEEFVSDSSFICVFPCDRFCANVQKTLVNGKRKFSYTVSENTYCVHQFLNSWINSYTGKIHGLYYLFRYGNKNLRDRRFKWFNIDGVIDITVFYPYGELTTGGRIIDRKIYDELKESEYIRLHEVDKNNLLAPRWRFWNFWALLQLRRLSECDYMLFDNYDLSYRMRSFFYLAGIICPELKFITINHHSDYLLCRHKKLVKRRERKILKKCDYVITVSPFVKDEMESFLPSEKIFYFPIPFNKTERPDHEPVQGKLLFVGSIIKRKGLEYLVDALEILKDKVDFTLDIVGKGPDKEYSDFIIKKIDSYGLSERVNFCGWLNEAELEKEYSSSYCFVFPSLTEGFGMVLIEAMSYGLPVIAFDNTAIPYTVHDGENGILCPDKDVKELSDGIFKMLTDSAFYEKCSNGALKTASSASAYEDFRNGVVAFVNELHTNKQIIEH